MAHAIAHSRPPSYRSHISDHEVILPPVHHLPKPPVAEEPELEDESGPNNIVVTSADVLSSSQPINELTDKSASAAADKLSFSVDIKDMSTDSSVVSVSSSTSSRSSRQQDGQVTIIHHQQAPQESVPAVSAPVIINRQGGLTPVISANSVCLGYGDFS